MKRTRLADRELPAYSPLEERYHTVSHIAGALLGVVALVWCLILANGTVEIISSVVYSLTMILLYTTSSTYHGLKHPMTKKVFQVLDHCTIYLFIAGTYTVILLCSLRLVNSEMAWALFAIEWVMAATAITLTAIDLKRYAPVSMVCYLVMGWAGIIAIKPALRALSVGGLVLLLAGGISYTLGSVIYMAGSKKRYAHAVFHVFILLGTLLHFFCIVFYVL